MAMPQRDNNIEQIHRREGLIAFAEQQKDWDEKERRKAERAERKDDVDRIEVERFFSRDKRCSGAGLVMTKLSKTTLGSIALLVLVANLFDASLSFFAFYFAEAVDGVPAVHLMEVLDDAA